jgi:hypothetical protein
MSRVQPLFTGPLLPKASATAAVLASANEKRWSQLRCVSWWVCEGQCIQTAGSVGLYSGHVVRPCEQVGGCLQCSWRRLRPCPSQACALSQKLKETWVMFCSRLACWWCWCWWSHPSRAPARNSSSHAALAANFISAAALGAADVGLHSAPQAAHAMTAANTLWENALA